MMLSSEDNIAEAHLTAEMRERHFMKVFVVDTNRKPLLPCHAAIARKLLKQGKAAVLRVQPFTIILKRDVQYEPRKLRLKIDPGSKVTGIAIIDDQASHVVYVAELEHHGQKIKHDLDARRAQRRSRRQRNTRYRKPRFLNRAASKRKGRIAPSLMHRVLTIETWVKRLQRYAPIGSISLELVRFDTQKIKNPEISGVEYQRGDLLGYEVREYLLEKWGRKCAYCNTKDIPLQIEHIMPRSENGSNRISNLTLACRKCNEKKSNQPIEKFLESKPDVLKRILSHVKTPLHDTAAVNTTRWKLFEVLKVIGLEIECGSGGRTKYNRTRNGFKKSHWADAANVGASTPQGLIADQIKPLMIKAIGHGSRQMIRVDKFGFPHTGAKSESKVHGFRMGDLVFAKVSRGKYRGVHRGRLSGVRLRGDFDIVTCCAKFTTSHKNIKQRQKSDGYAYAFEARQD